MTPTPRWFRPLAITALLWNLLGCAAYIADVRLTPDDIARLSAAQQAMYAARPAWAVGATATAVWFGALGCAGLVTARRWAYPLLLISLLGVVVQDVALFGIVHAASLGGPVPVILQGVVLAIAVGLVALARRASARGWLA